MTIKLKLDNLEAIASGVAVPSYRREQLSAGIMHFGLGNFHRAHQAWFLDQLFDTGTGHDWAIVGTGVMPFDTRVREALVGQDFLSTVVEQSADASSARVTGSMIDFIAPGDSEAIIEKLADPAIRIVSLTVTEGGYFIDPATQAFNPEHPQIVAEAAAPAQPKTTFGLICAGLERRRAAGTEAFTVMSCDNVPHNGVVTRNTLAGLARLSDPAFADWIEDNVAFPNGMVDRITPATSDRERNLLANDFGIDDAWPVFCEDFAQWVIEDNFPTGRPKLERIGVEFVSDVTPFEHMKIRILNGGHAIIAYPAGLLDIQFVHETLGHPLIAAFFDKIEQQEILPILPPVPNADLHAYYLKVRERIANPKIADTVRRLCFDGSNRQPKFIVPSIADRLEAGAGVAGLALESALWCRYCFGFTESGAEIEANDPSWDRLQEIARAAKDEPTAWLAMDDIYGDVAGAQAFRDAFATGLKALWADGVEAVLQRYIDNVD